MIGDTTLCMVCLGTSQDISKTATKFHMKKSLKLKQLKCRGKFLIVKWFWIFFFFSVLPLMFLGNDQLVFLDQWTGKKTKAASKSVAVEASVDSMVE